MMNTVLNYLWEFSLCLTISWFFYRLVLEKLTFHEMNRSFLLGALVFSLIVPFLSFNFFNTAPIIRDIILPQVMIGEGVVETSFIQSISWQEALLGIYLLGAFVMLTHLGLGLLKSFLLLKSADKLKAGDVTFAINSKFQPASFFHFILLPELRPEDPDQKQIVLHESVHVNKKHTYDLILIQVTKALLWFNPVVYLFEKSLREIHEFQADQGVTQSYSSFDYSRLLVRLISGEKAFQGIHYFSQFQTKKRIIMMNKEKSSRDQKSRFLLAIPMIAVLVFAFACEPESELPQDLDVSAAETVELESDAAETVIIEEVGSSETLSDSDSELIMIREIPSDGIYEEVDNLPSFPGGMNGLRDYLINNLEYPKQAQKLGVEGMVVVQFVVNGDGSVHDVEVLKGIGAGCDAEAKRVIEAAPNWEPGLLDGEAVPTRMKLPISFKLG